MAATVHNGNDVVNGICWFVAVVARGVVSQNDGPVAFVLGVAVFFRHLLPRRN